MNRFKKTMALTAACVIAATAVNVGGLDVNEMPQVTIGSIEAAAVEKITFELEANGTPLTKSTTQIKIKFSGNVEKELTVQNFELSEGVLLKDEADAVTGTGNTRVLKIKSLGDKKDGEMVNVKIIGVDAPVISSDGVNVKVNVKTTLSELSPTADPLTGKKSEDTSKSIIFGIGDTPAQQVGKSGFTVTRTKQGANAEIESVTQEPQGKIKITLRENIEANEVVKVTYNPKKADLADRITLVGDSVAAGFEFNVTNNVEATNKYEIEKFEVNGEKDKKTTTEVTVTFKTAPEALEGKDFVLDGATVSKMTKKPGSDDKIYVLEIKDVTKAEQKLSTNKVDTAFTGVKEFALNMAPAPSTGGGSTRSSVRPDSSTPSKKEEVKKEEPKKEEPKKEEAKKDEMANAPKSAEKVSTKLVIGQKTYTAMVNGQAVEKTMDVAPMVHQGRTVLPARMISELLGVDVKFDQASKTASFMYGEGNKVELTLGQKFMMVNGEKVALNADILNKDGRILLPVTDIQKAFAKLGLEATVSWDAATKSVTIEK